MRQRKLLAGAGVIQQLDEDDKQTIFKLIDKMLANKKFKDFFNNNVVAL